jgi:uncharacterized protein (TIGR00296 family)
MRIKTFIIFLFLFFFYINSAFGQSYQPFLNISPQEKKELLILARQTLENQLNAKKTTPKTISKRLNSLNYLVFVTLFNHGEIRACRGEKKDNLISSLVSACKKDLANPWQNKPITKQELKDIQILITILGKDAPITGRNLDQIRKIIEIGHHGLKIERGKNRAIFLENVPVYHHFGLQKTLQRLCRKAKLPQNSWQEKTTKLYKFETITFIEHDSPQGFRDILHGLPYLSLAEINKEKIHQAVIEGQNWLVRNQKKDGSFAYQYYPGLDKYSSKDNIVRQIATSAILARIGNNFNNEKYLNSAKKGVDYALKKIKYLDKKKNLPYLFENEQGTLGGNAFVLMSLTELKSFKPNLREKFLNSLLYMQNADGSFKTYYEPFGKSGAKDFFPGEAMLALAKYYSQLSPRDDMKILSALEKAFNYYSKIYWPKNKTTAFVPWHSQAAAEMYRITQEKKYADFVFEINDWLLKIQFTEKDSPYPDYLGGFYKKGSPPGMSTSSYAEGLAEAYVLAKQTDDKKREKKYKRALDSAIIFILSTQFNEENSFYVKNLSRSLGGFRTSLIDHSLRIDATQHACTALLKVLFNQ